MKEQIEYHGYTIKKCDLDRYYITDEKGSVVRSWVGYHSLLLAKTNVLIDIEQRGRKASLDFIIYKQHKVKTNGKDYS